MIAVLIPCYNESKTIRKVVEDFQRVLPEAEIYVYDNNSTDGSDEIARSVSAIVRYEYRQGKGMLYAVCFGILMLIVISWSMRMIPIVRKMQKKWWIWC